MSTLLAIWRACRVRRWHTNYELAGTDDRIDGHSGRVARIILKLHPGPSFALLIAALIHDDGEWGMGDIAHPAKKALKALEPAAWARIEATEEDSLCEIWQRFPSLTITEQAWLKFADRLDAYIWAAMHGARMDRNGWPADFDNLMDAAVSLGVLPAFNELVAEL